jgi:hypothetical protein
LVSVDVVYIALVVRVGNEGCGNESMDTIVLPIKGGDVIPMAVPGLQAIGSLLMFYLSKRAYHIVGVADDVLPLLLVHFFLLVFALFGV